MCTPRLGVLPRSVPVHLGWGLTQEYTCTPRLRVSPRGVPVHLGSGSYLGVYLYT